jgi:hypothetical protein
LCGVNLKTLFSLDATMDHNEINLDVKRTNRRHSTGRYGIKTNKTVKKHPIHTNSARNQNSEVISIIVEDSPRLHRHNRYIGYYPAATTTVPVSLNAQKNWEKVNNLKKSQDGT